MFQTKPSLLSVNLNLDLELGLV